MLSPLSNLDKNGFFYFPIEVDNYYQDHREEDLVATINYSFFIMAQTGIFFIVISLVFFNHVRFIYVIM